MKEDLWKEDLFILHDPPILILSAHSKEVNKIFIPEINFSKISTVPFDCFHDLICLGYFYSCLSDTILPCKSKIGNEAFLQVQFGREHISSGNLSTIFAVIFDIANTTLYLFGFFWYRYFVAHILFMSTAITKYCLAIFQIYLYQELQRCFVVAIV